MDRRDFLKSGILAAFLGPRNLSPPGGRKVALPQLRTTIGGNADANGNLTLLIRPSASWFAVFTLIAQATAGAPQWVLTGEGAPYGFGGGPKITIGAIYTNPGETLTLTVTGAAPGAVVSGAIYGFLGQNPEELPAFVIAGTGGGAGGVGTSPGAQTSFAGTMAGNQNVLLPVAGLNSILLYINLAVGDAVTFNFSPDGGTHFLGSFRIYNITSWPPVLVTSAQVAGGYYLISCVGFQDVQLAHTGPGPSPYVALGVTGTPQLPLLGQQVSASSQPVVIASDQSGVPVTFAATQKPLAFQNRVAFAATVTQVASVAAEAMLTLVPVRAGVAGAGVTTIPVTAGKVLRITEMTVNYRNNAAAAHFTRFTLRTNPTGAAVVASPALDVAEAYATAALALVGQAIAVPFPDGLEFTGTEQIGVSHLCDAAAVGFSSVGLTGFEYTP